MRLSYARALYLVIFVAAIVFSLRPSAAVDRALDAWLSPVRVLAELAAPFEWVRAGRVAAAEQSLAARADEETALRRELHADEWRFTLPQSASLASGRRFVRGDVVGRDPTSRDVLEVHLESGDASGIERGMPVIAGDAYVGRVARFEPDRPGVVWIELVTARGAFVGARAEVQATGRSGALVVGGVSGSSANAARAYLAVHHPEDPELFEGRVTVDETWSRFERFANEARGFELGFLERDPTGAAAVRPTLDYQNGLFHVAVVCPEGVVRAPESAHADELESGRWVRARVLSSRDPSRAFGGVVIGAGASDGVQLGAAVVFGTRLVGRVQSVSRWSAKVDLLGSRGFELGAVARVSSDERPLALGAIRSRGERDASGACRFDWLAPRPLFGESGESSAAIVFTGSGDRGVPRGLLVGRTALPARPGEAASFALEEFADGSELGELFVFVPDDGAMVASDGKARR
ncbi:MAG: rod shape-determining protein MreC [Planctomycetes bacterium]|nr:rod shape-determining protein MreC [Planctomycetota bacterium]